MARLIRLLIYEILDLSLDACMKPGLGLSWALRVSTNLDINYLTSDGETMAAHLNIYLWTT